MIRILPFIWLALLVVNAAIAGHGMLTGDWKQAAVYGACAVLGGSGAVTGWLTARKFRPARTEDRA